MLRTWEATPLYDGKGDHYSDLLEVEGISGVEKRGDYIHIERDIIDLRPLKLLEKESVKR